MTNEQKLESKDVSNEEKALIKAKSISRRLASVILAGALREMFTSYLHDARFTDKKVIKNCKKACDNFFWEFDTMGNNDQTYMEDNVARMMEHAEEVLEDLSYQSRVALFTTFVSVLDYLVEQWKHDVIYTDRKILYHLKLIFKTPTRHFNKVNKNDIEQALIDVGGHVEHLRETTEKILLGEYDEVSEVQQEDRP